MLLFLKILIHWHTEKPWVDTKMMIIGLLLFFFEIGMMAIFKMFFFCEMNQALGTFVHIQAKLGQKNLPRMVRWHRPPDT